MAVFASRSRLRSRRANNSPWRSPVSAANTRGQNKKTANPEWPLKDLVKEVDRFLPNNAVAARALETLADAVRVRDAGAHGDALARGAAAAARFGFEYPPRDPATAWEIVSRDTVSALVALREQLEPLAV